MSSKTLILQTFTVAVLLMAVCEGFSTQPRAFATQKTHRFFMSSEPTSEDRSDPMASATMDAETQKQLEKMRRAQELREQEVFMKKSLGKSTCKNCDWVYDETKGDVMMIGGMVQPGTPFADLPSNWRCPVCRASKDSFEEQVEEIPGFAVNQGYGFGTNAWSSQQKNLAVFGGLAAFFVLFLSGYALN
jgi:rubredoxin